MPTEFADHQRKAMPRAIREREGRWEEVDPDNEIARIGEGIGLSEDRAYELCSGVSWTKASSILVMLIGQGELCRAASAGSSDAKRT